MIHLTDTQTVQADFDRIALLEEEGWNHNNHYHAFLSNYISVPCENALEIGCGTGTFARLLAKHAAHVLAIDLSPQMIRFARERSADYLNIHYECADIMKADLPEEQFDYIVSIATFHHLPLEDALVRIKKALKVGGTLVVLDLFCGEGLHDILRSVLAMPISTILKLLKNGEIRASSQRRAAWAEHAKHDSYLTVSQVRDICQKLLPDAQVRNHLFWRYSLIWKKVGVS